MAAMAALAMLTPARRLARASSGIAISDAAAITIPGTLVSGACLGISDSSDSQATYTEAAENSMPRCARRGARPVAFQHVLVLMETPQPCRPAGHLDHAVEAESHECHAAGHKTGDQRG